MIANETKYASWENANARKDTRRVQKDTVLLVDVSTTLHVAYVQVTKELEKLKKPKTYQGSSDFKKKLSRLQDVNSSTQVYLFQ